MMGLFRILSLVVAVTAAHLSSAQAQAPPAPKPFESTEGRFSILFPETPTRTLIPAAGDKLSPQVQYLLRRSNGVLMALYDDMSGIAGISQADLNELNLAVQKKAPGKLLTSKALTLEGKYPGREFRSEMTSPSGIFRSQVYLVNGRFYQLMAIGEPAFTASAEAQEFFDSFRLAR